MRNRPPVWLAPALALGVFSLLLYGFNEHQIRTAAVANLQQQHLSTVHNAAYDVDEMQDALAKVLITRQPHMIITQLHLAARYAARADVETGRLEGDAKQTAEIQSFFNRVIAQTDALANKETAGRLTNSDRSEIHALFGAATQLELSIRKTQSSLLSSNAGAMVWHGQAVSKVPGMVVAGIQSNHAINQLVQTQLSGTTAYPANLFVSGSAITANKAVVAARQFFQVPTTVNTQVSRFGPAYDDHGYMVSFGTRDNTYPNMVVGVSLHGGKILWMHRLASAGTATLPPTEARQVAIRFLHRHGFSGLTLTESDHNGILSFYRFAPVIHHVVDATRPILVQVDRVTGSIVGFDASSYFLQAGSYVHQGAVVTRQSLSQGLQPSFKIESVTLTWRNIGNPMVKMLCYQVLGRTSDNTFVVTIDALTGRQLTIVKLSKDEV